MNSFVVCNRKQISQHIHIHIYIHIHIHIIEQLTYLWTTGMESIMKAISDPEDRARPMYVITSRANGDTGLLGFKSCQS